MPEISGIIQEYLEGTIKTIGKIPKIEAKTITENGTYTAPSEVDGYSPINVNVPIKSEVSATFTENGTYTPPSNKVYNEVIVNVPPTSPIIESKTITENGTYTAPSGVDGFSPVVVNVPTIEGVRISNSNADNRITLPFTDSNNYEYVIKFYNSAYQHNVSILGNSSSGYNIQLTEYSNTWYCDGGASNQLSYTPSSVNDFVGHFTFVSNAIDGTMGLSDRDIALFDENDTLIHKFGTKGTLTSTTPDIWLLSRSGTGVSSNAVIEKLTIKDKSNNNNIVCNYIPAMINVSGVKYSGIFDTINETYIINAYKGVIGGVLF